MKNINNMDETNEINILFKPLKYNETIKYSTNLYKKLQYKEHVIKFDYNFTYNNFEPGNPPRILNIKLCFFTFLQNEIEDPTSITLDSIILYGYKDEKYKILNDSDEFNKDEYSHNDDIVLYYNFNENRINIRIEFFSHKIDHFYFNLSEMSSIFMMKYLIYLKLKNIEAINHYKNLKIKTDCSQSKINDIDDEGNSINIKNTKSEIVSNNNKFYNYLIKLYELENVIKLYGNGIINNTYQGYNNKNETNRIFENKTSLLHVLNYYLSFSSPRSNFSDKENMSNNNNDINNNNNLQIKEAKEINISINKNKISIFTNTSEYTLSFIMTECRKDKIILGLDFRFNLLNYFSPYYIEEESKTKNIKFLNKSKIILYNGGGMKLFVYCLNPKCIYNTKYFVYHLGYGYFDLFNAMNNISCPLCKHRGKKLIEIKYIGMINAKWVYRGYLTGLKFSNVEGQGITILNDVIYRTKQILFSQQFLALNIQIEKYFSNNTITKDEKQKKFSTINTTYYTDNSNYSILSEENEQKGSINDDSKYSEISKVIPIKLMKNRIKKRKVKNRNQLRNFYSKNVINTANCEFNDYVFNKNTASCWDNCVKCDKKNNDCLIF